MFHLLCICFVPGSLILFDLLVHQRDPGSKVDDSTNDTSIATTDSCHSSVATATVSDSALVLQSSGGAIGHVEVGLPRGYSLPQGFMQDQIIASHMFWWTHEC